ncbi:hypothetical protein HanIR_Chr13g0656241 [Helianthus annuus]|nr:hypothetical protein HanIR_Chr13g0656241 [Helianthus annuus]
MAFFTGPIVFLNKSLFSSSNRALVNGSEKSTPSKSDSISSRTWCWLLNALLARSASLLSFPSTLLSLLMSFPYFLLISLMKYSMILWSKSSPPRWVSPCVARTSKTPLSSVKMLTSNVPPPRSNTRTFFSTPFLFRPYAIAAAVGSLMILTTFKPAIFPASLVACLWASLKYAARRIKPLHNLILLKTMF